MIDVDGIYASEWEKFHPDQFISIWKFEDYIGNFKIRLALWGTSTASSIPEYLVDEDLDNFVIQPVDDEGEQIPLVEAIARREK